MSFTLKQNLVRTSSFQAKINPTNKDIRIIDLNSMQTLQENTIIDQTQNFHKAKNNIILIHPDGTDHLHQHTKHHENHDDAVEFDEDDNETLSLRTKKSHFLYVKPPFFDHYLYYRCHHHHHHVLCEDNPHLTNESIFPQHDDDDNNLKISHLYNHDKRNTPIHLSLAINTTNPSLLPPFNTPNKSNNTNNNNNLHPYYHTQNDTMLIPKDLSHINSISLCHNQSTDTSPLSEDSREDKNFARGIIINEDIIKSSKKSRSINSHDNAMTMMGSKPLKNRSKKIKKLYTSEKKVYEISRFFVKNYVGAFKSAINNICCEEEIKKFVNINTIDIIESRRELDNLLKEYPKHNRMQLYKLMTNKTLNPIFQYFLIKKVYSWIFASSKMQDKKAHLMARKNFLHLCQRANELTPYNFRIALNHK